MVQYTLMGILHANFQEYRGLRLALIPSVGSALSSASFSHTEDEGAVENGICLDSRGPVSKELAFAMQWLRIRRDAEAKPDPRELLSTVFALAVGAKPIRQVLAVLCPWTNVATVSFLASELLGVGKRCQLILNRAA